MLQKRILCCFLILIFTASCGQAYPNSIYGFINEEPDLQNPEINLMESLQQYGDILRTHDPDIDRFLKDPRLTSITREYGQSTIPLGQLPFKSELAKSDLKPWSSWWYPKREDTLFKDVSDRASSTLTKYDLVRMDRYERTRRGSRPGSAALHERKQHNPNAVAWEGLCDAWSIAATVKREPRRPVTIPTRGQMVTFKVGELKALLLKTFEAIDESQMRYFGQRFTGNDEGWIYPDLFPEQFHRFLEVRLFQQKRTFIMDHDAGVEVWNVPVFKANYVIESIQNDPDSVFVRTWLYSAEATQAGEKDLVGTKEAVREYNYVLHGARNEKNELIVDSGYWIKGPDGIDSRKNHPDYFMHVNDGVAPVRKSWNPEIDIDLVDEILNQAY